MPLLDHDRCYRAVQSRDRRFDGWFVTAVRTTGIYCRPSCPAVTPKPGNVEFFPTAAAAQQRGYRACKRCRPDATPGSPEWNVRGDVVARAMRLVADGVVDREGVGGLARRLAYSERHLTRLVTDELGAGPLAIARAQRAQHGPHADRDDRPGLHVDRLRRRLRQRPPVQRHGPRGVRDDAVRAARRGRPPATLGAAGAVELDLAVREPFDAEHLVAFLAARAVPGVEAWDGDGVPPRARPARTATAWPYSARRRHGPRRPAERARCACGSPTGATSARPCAASAACSTSTPTRSPSTPRSADDPALAPSVAAVAGPARAGQRRPVRDGRQGVVGQQISVAGARTVAGRIVAAAGAPLTIDGGPLTHVFPTPAALAALDPTCCRCRAAAAARSSSWPPGSPTGGSCSTPAPTGTRSPPRSLDVPGIGPWTAGYVLMRGLGDPDVFLPTDLGVRVGLARLGVGRRSRRAVAAVALLRPAPPVGDRRRRPRHRPRGGRHDDHAATTRSTRPIGPLTLVAADGELREVRFPNAAARRRRRRARRPDRPRARRRGPAARRVLRRRPAGRSTCRSTRGARRSSSTRGGAWRRSRSARR